MPFDLCAEAVNENKILKLKEIFEFQEEHQMRRKRIRNS